MDRGIEYRRIEYLSHRRTVHETRARLQVGAAPAHIAYSPDGELAFIGCESSDEVAVIELETQTVVELINAGQLA